MSVSEKEIIFELMIVVKIEKREIRVCKIYFFFIIYNYNLICFNNVVNINIWYIYVCDIFLKWIEWCWWKM